MTLRSSHAFALRQRILSSIGQLYGNSDYGDVHFKSALQECSCFTHSRDLDDS